ncbi:MAG: DNA polymerase III [Planctomycetales bacterium]|nr:DNA polymerase III [Planctomycetales bacterium]NIN78240.1 DNA polymerase III [Planctomycetales bacterium]NIO35431.1 DNA polymerase III [Planctomycetales bacterium]NIP70577.1 DNA polymerase III [Planctomycetales bacterium]
MANDEVANYLDEIAGLLEAQGANAFRIRAYRTAAANLRQLARPVQEILDDEGLAGLRRLPGIGRSLAHAIAQLLHAGHLALLDRLRGDDVAERLFATVPNIGPGMARRIHEQLGIENLAELEVAAHDGRLATVPGMGQKRLRGVRESLAGRFRRQPVAPTPTRGTVAEQPPVAQLLEIDRQYRHLVELDRLPRIAPRRFNPTGQAWLPILHTQRGDRHYTALFSNTARAHELGMTHDWVVIYRDDHDGHGQWTVITSAYGSLSGRRIVRGREDDCRRYYEQHEPDHA